MKTHNRVYKSDEEFFSRFQIFKQNLRLIEEKNKQGGATFAVNKFADLSKEEFAELYLMKDLPPYDTEIVAEPVDIIADVPDSFDWRLKGAVTPVKDQGQCGSCWAFSATENVESVYQIAKTTLPKLGPQQMVDCIKTGCYGCSGGWPYLALGYIVQAGGQDSESTYPYTARDGTCKFKTNVAAKISNWKKIPKDEKQIQSSLISVAPFSICVDASEWQFYSGGVFMAKQCGGGVDHCTQLVGYDTKSLSTPYWIVRNSWGTDWGLSGFIYLEMFEDTCLMADYVTTAVVNP
jgi:cathepsin F